MFLFQDLHAYGRLNEVDGDTRQFEEFPFPIIEDTNRMLAKQLGMIDPDQFDTKGSPLTARAVSFPFIFLHYLTFPQVFIIGPDKKLKASILYPATTGRNFEQVILQ